MDRARRIRLRRRSSSSLGNRISKRLEPASPSWPESPKRRASKPKMPFANSSRQKKTPKCATASNYPTWTAPAPSRKSCSAWSSAAKRAEIIDQNSLNREARRSTASSLAGSTPGTPNVGVIRAATCRITGRHQDSYTDTATDTRKNIKFTVGVTPGSDPKKCVMVNWIKGTAKNKDGTFRKVQMFDKVIDYNLPDAAY